MCVCFESYRIQNVAINNLILKIWRNICVYSRAVGIHFLTILKLINKSNNKLSEINTFRDYAIKQQYATHHKVRQFNGGRVVFAPYINVSDCIWFEMYTEAKFWSTIIEEVEILDPDHIYGNDTSQLT